MLQTLLFAAVASSGLVLGAAIGAVWEPPWRVLAFLLAFASGALLAALAYELFDDAAQDSGLLVASVALVAGASTFVGATVLLDRHTRGRETTGFALVAAVTLDGVPENLALGVTLATGGSLVLLVAIFSSNFAEALHGAVSMRSEGGSARRSLLIWSAAALLLAAALVVGRFALLGAPDAALGALLAFAGGAVLASLADTLMPEAYRDGGPLVAFGTTAGFLLSYALSTL